MKSSELIAISFKLVMAIVFLLLAIRVTAGRNEDETLQAQRETVTLRHKSIELPEDFDPDLQQEIRKYLETNLTPHINRILGYSITTTSRIDITVGKDGKVKVITINGQVTRKTQELLEVIILKHNYHQFDLQKSWTYKIKYR